MTTTSKENKILNAQGDKNITKKDLIRWNGLGTMKDNQICLIHMQ